MTYCVYKHTVPNGKVYIGITRNDPWIRWGNGHGYRENKPFFNDIVLYGWLNIKHEILYEGLSENDAKDIEAKLIAQYKSYMRDYGYNVQRGLEYGYIEQKQHMSREEYRLKAKELCNTKEYKEHCKAACKTNKPVYQYDKQGNFIAEYFSKKEAERSTGISQFGIRDCIKGECKSYKGFIWSYMPPGQII